MHGAIAEPVTVVKCRKYLCDLSNGEEVLNKARRDFTVKPAGVLECEEINRRSELAREPVFLEPYIFASKLAPTYFANDL